MSLRIKKNAMATEVENEYPKMEQISKRWIIDQFFYTIGKE